ncbi:hypothetical protein HZS_2384, partial [Henneguya salminicola]
MPHHLRRRSSSRKFSNINKNKVFHQKIIKTVNKLSKRSYVKSKYRNRSRNNKRLINMSSPKPFRLPTHFWHCKRFHMITKYKYRLPFCTTSKTYRPVHKNMKSSVVVQDISYLSTLKITGPFHQIKSIFLNHINFVKDIQPGIEYLVLFYRLLLNPNSLLGPIRIAFIEVINCEACVLLWCHPIITDNIINALRESTSKHDLKVTLIDGLARLRFVGPLSMRLLSNIFIDEDSSVDNKPCESLSKCPVSPYDFPTSKIFGLTFDSSKLNKKHGSIYAREELEFHSPNKNDVDRLISGSLSTILEILCKPCSNTSSIKAAALIVLNNDMEQCNKPLENVSIQELNSGVDVIFNSIHATAILNCCVINGSCVGGLREYLTIARDSFLHVFPDDYPDIIQGKQMEIDVKNLSSRKVLKRLKNIDNFGKLIKINLLSIFKSQTYSDFSVIRQNIKLQDLKNFPFNSFVPIGIVACKKGYPNRLDAIYGTITNESCDLSTNESYKIIGYVTDGDFSLTIGKGVGKGFILTNEFENLKIIDDDSMRR